MSLFSLLMILAGALIGGAAWGGAALLLSLCINALGYLFSDRLTLRMAGALPVTEAEAPELYRIVRTLCGRAELPLPALYLIPEAQPNACAVGRHPGRSAIAVTDGLLEQLDRDELEAVIAHELGHIKNGDTLGGGMAAIPAGGLTWLLRSLPRLPALILLLLFAPFAACLIRVLIPRDLEFRADAAATRMIATPRTLARALRKLADGRQAVPLRISPAAGHLYIVDPCSHRRFPFTLFGTHPRVEQRIDRLEKVI